MEARSIKEPEKNMDSARKLMIHSGIYHWKRTPAEPFCLELQKLEKGFANPAVDIHSAVHIGILLDGDINGRKTKYDFYLTASCQPHGNSRSIHGAELLLITFNPMLLLNAVIDKAPVRSLLYLPFRKAAPAYQSATARTLCRKFTEEILCCPDWKKQRQKIWLRIVEFVCDIASLSGEENLRNYRSYEKLLPAMEILSAGEKLPLSPTEAAKYCALSDSSFYQLFRDFAGMPFSLYELRFRLNRAVEDLGTGKYTIKDIAGKWHFSDASHFSRTFKKYFGIYPSEYNRKTIL